MANFCYSGDSFRYIWDGVAVDVFPQFCYCGIYYGDNFSVCDGFNRVDDRFCGFGTVVHHHFKTDFAENFKKFKGKRNIIDCLNFTKETLDVLAEKERLINGYINEIEMIEVVGDKKLIHDIEIDRKKANKRDKQLMIKQKQDQIDNMKRQRAVERAQRVVIKGRKVPKDYPILNEKKKKKKDDGANEFDDYAMLHYSSDENN